jgi:hypothetical protein
LSDFLAVIYFANLLFFRHFVSALSGDSFEEAVKKLDVLDQADKERVARESALNELQAFVFDLQDKIYQVILFVILVKL